MTEIAVAAESVWKNFRLYHERNRYIKAAILRGRRARYEEFWALQDVSFEIPHGSTFGIIGSNGSGKSTMLKCLAGILFPNQGRVVVNGRLAALLELGAGFHPELSGRENIYLNGAILSMSRREITKKYDEIVEFAGLEKFIDTPVKNFSSGMTVRLGFAIAAHVDPEILLIDEVLSVGDQAFQRKSLEKIEEFRRDGRTIIFVSHGLTQVQQLCTEVAWLEKGQLRQIGPVNEVIAAYTGSSYGPESEDQPNTGKRWGTGKASVLSVDVLNSSDEIANVIKTNESIALRISFEAHSLIEDLVVFVKIENSHGVLIWSTSTRTNGISLPRVIGQGAVKVSLQSLPILEGSYNVTVALRNARETVEFDHWENVTHFDVHQTNNFDEGIVDIKASWTYS
jgi:ABC-2 type transport system ATP-binding protein